MNYALKYNYAYFEELRLKNPAAYSEWYQRNYAQRYTPTVVTGGTGTALGSIATPLRKRIELASTLDVARSMKTIRPCWLTTRSPSSYAVQPRDWTSLSLTIIAFIRYVQ